MVGREIAMSIAIEAASRCHPGNMLGLSESPEYQLRRDQALKDIERYF